MLRFLVIALAFGISDSQQGRSSAYQPGQEYVYDYDTQVVTGIPGGSKIYSGLKFKSAVRLQFKTAARALLKFENVKVFKINDLIEDIDPTKELIPEGSFKELHGPEADDIRAHVQLPLQFNYINGHVTDIQSDPSDPYWSMNIKRGLLGMFEINLDQRLSLGESLPHRERSATAEEFYTVMEPGVSGTCETTYQRTPEVTSDGEPRIRLMKVRNYGNCLDRPEFTFANVFGYFCAQCEKDRTEPLSSNSMVRYYLAGSNNQFMIQSAISESQHVYTQYSQEGGQVATFINQTLTLVKSESARDRPIPRHPSPKSHPEGLKADLPNQVNQKHQPSDESSDACQPSQCTSPNQSDCRHPEDQQRIKTKITKLLFTLSTITNSTIDEESSALVTLTMETLRSASHNVLADIWKLYRDKTMTDESMKRRRQILLDLIPASGTPASVWMLNRAIEANEVTPGEAKNALIVLAIQAQPNKCVTKWLQSIVKLPALQKDRPMRASAWLCYGAVVNRIERKHNMLNSRRQKEKSLAEKVIKLENQHIVKRLIQEKASKIVHEMEESSQYLSTVKDDFRRLWRELFETNEPYDKTLALKTAGNAGFHELLPDLEHFIADKRNPSLLRTQAIVSLYKMIPHSAPMIREMLLPIYFDFNEPEDVRIVAFFVSAMSEPPLPILRMIQESLRRETNPHVGTFVYTFYEQMSNSSHPCRMAMAKNASFVLQGARRFDPKFHYSRYIDTTYYSDTWKTGMSYIAAMISSPHEFLPKTGAISMGGQFLGADAELVEIGFYTQGMQRLLSKLMGKSPADLFRSSQSEDSDSQTDGSSEEGKQQVKDVHQQLNLSSRELSEPDGNIYLRLYGYEIWFMDLNRDSLLSLVRKGHVHINYREGELRDGIAVKFYRSFLLSQAEHHFATEAGLPIHLKLRGSTMIKVDGTIKLVGEPALFKKNRPGKDNNLIKTDFELYPSAVYDLEGLMEVDAFYYKNGAKFMGRMSAASPMIFSYGYNPEKNKHMTSVDVSKLKENFAKLEIKPTTYIYKEPHDIHEWPSTPDLKDINAADGAVITTISNTFGGNRFGIALGIKGQLVSRNFLRGVPYCPFSGRQLFLLKITPGVNPPKQIEIEFTPIPDVRRQPQPTQRLEPSHEESSIMSLISKQIGKLSSLLSSSASRRKQDLASEMTSLVEKFRNSSQIDENADMTGFVFRYVGVGSNPQREMELSGLIQAVGGGDQFKLNFKIKRSPNPEEHEPWESDMEVDVTSPRELVEPEQLLDSKYQGQIHREIQIHLKRDGKLKFRKELERHLQVEENKVSDRLQSSTSVKRLIDELVRPVIEESEKSSDQTSQVLASISRKQKRIEKEIKQLRNKVVSKKDSKRRQQEFQSIAKKAKEVSDLMSQKLTQDSQKFDTLKKSNLVKYVVQSQQEIVRKIQKIARYVQHDTSEQQSIQQSIRQLVADQKELQQKQIRLSDIPDSSPSDKPLRDQLKALSQQQKESIKQWSSSQQTESSAKKTKLDQMITKHKEVKEALYEKLQQSPEIDSTLEQKLIEVMLQHKQVLENVKQNIEDSEKSYSQRQQQSSQQTPDRSGMVQRKEHLKKQLDRTVKVVAKLVSVRQENRVLAPILTSQQREQLRQMQKIEVKQILAMIDMKSFKDKPEGSEGEWRSRKLEQSYSKLRSCQQEMARASQQPDTLSSIILIKAVKISQMQLSLLQKLQQDVSKEAIKHIAVISQWSRQLQDIRKGAEDLITEQISLSKRLLRTAQQPDDFNINTTENQNDQPSQNPTVEWSDSESRSYSTRSQRNETAPERQSQEQPRRNDKQVSGPQELFVKMMITFGGLSAPKKTIHMEFKGTKSIQQLLWEQQQVSPCERSRIMRKYLDEKDGSERVTKRYALLKEELNFLRHFHFHLSYTKSDYSLGVRYFTWQYLEHFKYQLYNQMVEHYPLPNWQPGKLEVLMDIMKNNEQMDMLVKTEYEMDQYYGMYIPYYYRAFSGMMQDVRRPYRSSLHSAPISILKTFPSQCQIQQRRIRTFDDKEYEIPDTKGCDVVLAMDCSSAASFAVKVSENKQQKDMKKVKILVDGRKIEIIPEQSSSVIKIDGEINEMPTNGSLDVKKRDSQERLAKIVKMGKDLMVKVEKLGVEVRSDGRKVSVKSSPFYYSKLCGLCGNYDGKPSNDNNGPQQQKADNPACLAAHYALSNDQCEAAEVKQQCRSSNEPSSNMQTEERDSSRPNCRPKPVTMKATRRTNKICFSLEPVKKCPSGCRPVQRKIKRVNLTCLDRSSQRAQKLEAQSARQPLDLKGEKVDMTRNYQQHESCKPRV